MIPVGADQKESPVAGATRRIIPRRFQSHELLGANAGAAGIVARFFPVFLVDFFLLLAGLTGFLFRLPLLLTGAVLITLAAPLFLLGTLFRHSFIPFITLKVPDHGAYDVCVRRHA